MINSIWSHISHAASYIPIPVLRTVPTPKAAAPAISHFRQVFQTSDQMKSAFVNFLQTIFFKLDDKKVLSQMEKILADPTKTDEQIYKELLGEIGNMKKSFAPLWEIYSLGVLRKGMGKQAASLLESANPEQFQNYMEIYDRRYLEVIRKMAGIPLKGTTIGICNHPEAPITMTDRIQAGKWLPFYPYKNAAPLNEPGCTKPFENPSQTHKPIGNEVADGSIDLIACLGGLHHVPPQKLDPFIDSLNQKLKPGGMILFRDHNVADSVDGKGLSQENLCSIVSLVHTFVNASDQESWEVESKEVRNFKSMDQWAKLMEEHQFTRISPQFLVLKDDPTENGMAIFAKTPQNLEELRQATRMLKDCARAKNAHCSTWIEWGNVRSSKQYAEFIQDHHSYAFDYIGQMRQHWKHFVEYINLSRQEGISLKEMIFSSDFAMNLFILLSVTIQMVVGKITSLPSSLIARMRHGEGWRSVSNLTDLEKYEAQVEKEYSDFIDHTPFYQFDFLAKIKNVWSVVWNSQESYMTKTISTLNAAIWTLQLLAKALISAPVRAIFTSSGNVAPDTIKVLIKDPQNELQGVIARFEKEKNPEHNKDQKIEVIYTTPDGHKLVSFPRYRSLTQICGYLSQTSKLELLEVGGQEKISVDVLLDQLQPSPQVDGATVVYEMEKLQDPQARRYVTYHIAASALKGLLNQLSPGKVEYIHE